MSTHPIGIFDSGIGGTSIFKEIHQLLANEHIIYLADSKNAPYGNKSKPEIQKLSIKNTELLLKHNCKTVVVACNTATTNAIAYLRANYNVPFIGIEPAIKPAAINTKTKAIGILATKGTLSSEQIGEGIVSLIEDGQLYSKTMRALLLKYVTPMLKANIDHLVLGCTHYPYLIPLLKELLPDHVKIIDSGEAVAKQTKAILNTHELINSSTKTPKINFFTNGKVTVLDLILDHKFSCEFLDF